MSPFSELTPPLESFSGIPAFLKRLVQICLGTMPWLLLGSAVIASVQVSFGSLSPMAQQLGFSWQLFVLLALIVAGWIILTAALNAFIVATVSVALGATTVPLGQALTTVARRLPRVVGYFFVVLCVLCVGFVCLILPGIYLTLRLFPVVLVALFEPNVNPLRRSWELTQYRTLEVFISYVLILVATFVTTIAIGLTISLMPSIPGLVFLVTTLTILLTYTIPFVFWLLLYGWFRADIYEPSIAGPEEVYA